MKSSNNSQLYPGVLSLDVMDISGEAQRDLSHNIVKTRLDTTGAPIPNSHSAELRNKLDVMNDQTKDNYCGSCYGGVVPASGCCNTCEEVRQAYVNKGWSFSNPDSIEQVSQKLTELRSLDTHSYLPDLSAYENTGRTS